MRSMSCDGNNAVRVFQKKKRKRSKAIRTLQTHCQPSTSLRGRSEEQDDDEMSTKQKHRRRYRRAERVNSVDNDGPYVCQRLVKKDVPFVKFEVNVGRGIVRSFTLCGVRLPLRAFCSGFSCACLVLPTPCPLNLPTSFSAWSPAERR